MTDQRETDSDLRRRAAWLLGMLAVVAVLFVVVLTTLLDSSGDGTPSNDNARPDDTLVTTPSPTSSAGTSTSASTAKRTQPSSTAPTSPAARSTSPATATRTCPSTATCALQGDYGKAIEAINAYRTQNGKKAVPGTVSRAAQECARTNGSGCKGGWAESQVPALSGDAAVKKVQRLGKLLDPMKSFSVGWALDPGSKQYYFAVIRQN